jgi:L-fucono-1,5-lactonase
MAERIDAHQHFWRYRPETHPWISAAMPQLKRDFLPADLKPLLGAAGFDGCVAVQAQHTRRETEWLLKLADEYPIIRGVVGWVDLCADDVAAELETLATHPRLRGVRHLVQDEPDERFLLRPEFLRGISALGSFDLTYDILIYSRHLPVAAELVQRFPSQRFVVDHLAKPDIRHRRVEVWKRGMAALAHSPNVCCKLSGLVTEADWQAWKPADFTAYLDGALDRFGADRLMIGSDWPVCTLAGAYADVIAVVTDFIARLSPDEQDAILGGTAARFYALPQSDVD